MSPSSRPRRPRAAGPDVARGADAPAPIPAPIPVTDDSRQRILDATIEIASERGYDGTSIALVSKRSGLPVGSIYWHFANKDALLAAVVERSYQQWRAGQSAGGDSWAVHHGKVLTEVLTRTLLDSPEFLRLGLMLAIERRPVEATARETFLRFRAESLERMVGVFERAVTETRGAADATLARRLGELTVAVADGLFVAYQARPGDLDVRGLIELYVAAIDGLLMGRDSR